jgi:hypothetical protein
MHKHEGQDAAIPPSELRGLELFGECMIRHNAHIEPGLEDKQAVFNRVTFVTG